MRRCEGLGPAVRVKAELAYRRFACLASSGLPSDPVETVAVTYVLVPLEPYRSPTSRHALTQVRFTGFGVP